VAGGPAIFPAYDAARAGLIRLTETVRSLDERCGVRVSCVVPGLILTERVRARLAERPPAERVTAEAGAVRSEEVAAVVEQLVRDLGSAGRTVAVGR
jgi:NAD(P)-dependent dehydrogenase (short-subunit alcohol dehydrogenase family)